MKKRQDYAIIDTLIPQPVTSLLTTEGRNHPPKAEWLEKGLVRMQPFFGLKMNDLDRLVGTQE